MKNCKIDAGTRLGAMLLDHIVMTFIAMITFIPGMLSEFASAFEVSHKQTSIGIFGGMSYVGLVGFALYICKDSVKGRSIAKRALKLQVVEYSTDDVASPFRCFIRNIFCILWPIEALIALVNPGRRIGDIVAGTKLTSYSPDRKSTGINYWQTGFTAILAYGFMLLLTFPFEALSSKIKNKQVTYIQSSVNEQAARETVQLFEDSLGIHLSADVLVFDHIKEDKDLKYVSVILRLKENYFENGQDFDKIKSATVTLLLTKFTERSFVGQVKYVYQQPGSLQATTLSFDWRKDTR